MKNIFNRLLKSKNATDKKNPKSSNSKSPDSLILRIKKRANADKK